MDSASAPTRQAADQLQKLGEDVWLIEGDKCAKTGDTQQPHVVVIFGWMDAKISHIRKYSNTYRNLFPSANLLLIQSHSNFFWSSRAKRAASLQPAVTYLDNEGITATTVGSGSSTLLHLHAFSNGGAAQMTTLGEILKVRQAKQARDSSSRHTLPARSLVIDSAPGGEALKGLLTAFTMPLSTLAKLPVATLVTVAWAAMKAYAAIVRPKPFFVKKIQVDLIDPTVLPKSAKRLYIYSKTDAIILAEDTESHIAQAKHAKLDVSVEVYKNSPHVSHARTDGDRYWKAVIDLWRRSV